jgi:hypothetical protein
MSFEWNRIHKSEEYLDNIISDTVFEYVCQFYNVEDILELSHDQIVEIDKFRYDILSEYSPLQRGFSDLYNRWESEQEW